MTAFYWTMFAFMGLALVLDFIVNGKLKPNPRIPVASVVMAPTSAVVAIASAIDDDVTFTIIFCVFTLVHVALCVAWLREQRKADAK